MYYSTHSDVVEYCRCCIQVRNKVYTCIVSLRPANLIYYQSRSPAELLKSSGLTQVCPLTLLAHLVMAHLVILLQYSSAGCDHLLFCSVHHTELAHC